MCPNSQELLIWVIVDYGCLLPFEIRCYYVVRMYIFWDDNAKAHLIFCFLPVWPNCTMHNAVSGTHCRLQINLSNLFDELLKSDRNLTLGRIPVLLPPRHLSLSPIKAPGFYNNDHLSFPLRRCPIWYCWDIYQYWKYRKYREGLVGKNIQVYVYLREKTDILCCFRAC